jgi:hypothetical protein
LGLLCQEKPALRRTRETTVRRGNFDHAGATG